MNIQESINRGFNLLSMSIIGLTGIAFLPEVFLEKDIPDKFDDLALFILAAIGVWWYTRSRNRFIRSAIPVTLVLLALVVKIIGIIIEHDDPDALGDDIGGLILLVSSSILVVYQYQKTKKLLVA